jgi:uncharacterized protein YoxC
MNKTIALLAFVAFAFVACETKKDTKKESETTVTEIEKSIEKIEQVEGEIKGVTTELESLLNDI